MSDTVHQLPPAEIDEGSLPRDRTTLDPEALQELQMSIAGSGLRQPIEVFALAEPREGAPRYGLISGFRRLAAVRALGLATIPAFIRRPADVAQAMADMIAENEIRADLSPWERARIVVEARDQGLFDTLDEAVARLYPALNRHRRSRVRALAEVVEGIPEGVLTEPEALSQAQLLRLGTAIRAGLGDLIETALSQSSDVSPDAQWRLLVPIIEEAEEDARQASDYTGPERRRTDYKLGRPRRVVRPRAGLTIRRVRTADGWSLVFTGPEATGPLVEDIMDHVEATFGREF